MAVPGRNPCHTPGRYEEAEPLLRDALEILKKQAVESDHPDRADVLNNLAEVCIALHKNEEAELLLQEALNIRRRVLEPNHPHFIGSLGTFYKNQGKYEQAKTCYQEALDICNKLGPKYILTGLIKNNLAKLYYLLKKYKQAKPLYREALEIYKQVRGEDDDQTKKVEKNYNELLQEMNKEDEAAT